ncbi:MAG: VWA domain-containing protein [Planctomycetes bacterium]|nr:VWA domain-containing protein [Planctomycetota bacterium]
MSENFIFGSQWYLLFLAIPLMLYVLKPSRGGAAFGAYNLLRTIARPSKGPKLFTLLMASGLGLLIIALARPQYGSEITEYNAEGRDLILVIDLSGSMQFDDMTDENNNRITRLQTVITAANTFIEGRPNDRIGLVFFSERALSSCPVTHDHGTLKDILVRTQENLEGLWKARRDLLGQGTNIGLGLGYALKALIHIDSDKENDEINTTLSNINKPMKPHAKKTSLGRAIILITDGKDSYGKREPLIAARHARDNDIRIHAIGVGNPQGTITNRGLFGNTSVQRVSGDQLPDMNLLKSICSMSNGVAMAADNRDELDNVFKEIDQLEPSPRNQRTRNNYSDHFDLPLLIGLALCACALLFEPRLRGAVS